MIDFRKIRATLRELKRVYMLTKDSQKGEYYEQSWTIYDLIDCKSVRSLYHWIDAVEKDERLLHGEFENTFCQTGKSVIYPLCCLVRGLFPEERILFVKALRMIREHKSFHYGYNSFVDMKKETDAYHRDHNGSIILFQGTLSCYMAVGRSAELLCEKLGWQTADTHPDLGISCMFICDYSLLLIGKKMDYEISRKQLDFDLICLDQENEACLEFSLQQQLIDYFRFLTADDKFHLPTCGLCEILPNGLFAEHEIKYPFIEISEDSICIFDNMAMKYLIVSGNSWSVSPEDLPLVNKLADFLYFNIEKLKNRHESFGRKYEIQGAKCMDAFYDLKDEYSDSFLMADFHGVVESYGNDAVWFAWHYDIPLWCRRGNNQEISPMVIVPDDVVTRILEEEPKAVLGKTDVEDYIQIMALWPNALNHGLRDKTAYKKPRVYQREDGKYVVSAYVDGRLLPECVLEKKMVDTYENYPAGIMKAAVLKQILWYVYTEDNGKKLKSEECG